MKYIYSLPLTISCVQGFLVEFSLMLHALANGVSATFPSILNPSILSLNSTDIKATRDEASWIAACSGISGIIGLLVLSPIMQTYGRKITHVCINLADVAGWIMLSLANGVPTLLIGRLLQGFSKGGYIINSVILSEYADPKRRGYFITINKLSAAFGILSCHCLSLLFSWRQISTIVAFLSLSSAILTFFWPESPAYLAMKGKFVECNKSFYWLHCDSVEKNKELKMMIAAQTDRIENKTQVKRKITKKLFRKFYMRDFLLPLINILCLVLAVDLSGKFYYAAYIIEIMTKLIGDNPGAVYSSIVNDSFIVIALMLSGIVVFYCKRRTLIFIFGFIASTIMLLISLVEYIKKEYSIGSNCIWLTPALLITLVFVIHLGFSPVIYILSGEIFPLEHRGLGSCISGIGLMVFYITTIKLTPILMSETGFQGTFACYGIGLALCLIVPYFNLPETKDRTLQDIEDEVKNITRTSMELKPILIEKQNEHLLVK